jgi:hypothetical protein
MNFSLCEEVQHLYLLTQHEVYSFGGVRLNYLLAGSVLLARPALVVYSHNLVHQD